MRMLQEIVGICLLTSPFIWEVYNDRKGDAHITRGPLERYQMPSKKVDVMARCLLAFIASCVNHFLTDRNFWASLVLAGSIHFLLFDYAIAYVLLKNKVIAVTSDWFTYLGSKGMDNVSLWRDMSPVNRLVIRILVFLIACIIYEGCN